MNYGMLYHVDIIPPPVRIIVDIPPHVPVHLWSIAILASWHGGWCMHLPGSKSRLNANQTLFSSSHRGHAMGAAEKCMVRPETGKRM